MPKTREELEKEKELEKLEDELKKKGRLEDLKSQIIRFVEDSPSDHLSKLGNGNTRIILYGNGKGILIYPSIADLREEDHLKNAIIRLSEFGEDIIKYDEMTPRQKVITCKAFLYSIKHTSNVKTWEQFINGPAGLGDGRTIVDLIIGNKAPEENIKKEAERRFLDDYNPIYFVDSGPNLPKITQKNALIVIHDDGFMIFPSLETVADDKLLGALIFLDSETKRGTNYASLNSTQKEIAVAALTKHIKEEGGAFPDRWEEFIEENPKSSTKKYNSILKNRRNAELADILRKMGHNLCFVKGGEPGVPKLQEPLTKKHAYCVDIVYKKPYYMIFPYPSCYFKREDIAKALDALDNIKVSTPYDSLDDKDKEIALCVLDKKLGKGNTDLKKIQKWSDYLEKESSQGKGSPRISYKKMLENYRKKEKGS